MASSCEPCASEERCSCFALFVLRGKMSGRRTQKLVSRPLYSSAVGDAAPSATLKPMPQNTAVRVIIFYPQINASMCCPVDVVISDDSLWGNIKTSDGRSKRRRDCHKTRNTSSLVSHFRLVASSIMLCSFLSVARRIRCCHAHPGGQSWYSLPYQPRTAAFISNPIQCKTSSISPSSTSTARSYTSKNKPDEFEDLSSYDATFNLSGYQRPKVNWYPGHIAK